MFRFQRILICSLKKIVTFKLAEIEKTNYCKQTL